MGKESVFQVKYENIKSNCWEEIKSYELSLDFSGRNGEDKELGLDHNYNIEQERLGEYTRA